MSVLVFVGNACFRKPTVYPEVIFPGFCSGVMWGIAQIGFFYANQVLG
jgi:hypothetical protein